MLLFPRGKRQRKSRGIRQKETAETQNEIPSPDQYTVLVLCISGVVLEHAALLK